MPRHHLSFEQATIDWQLWIDPVREPLPRNLVPTYYLAANTFYRRVADGAQERFVVVTAPAGVVFVATQPLAVPGAVVRVQTPQAFTVSARVQVDVMTNVAVR